MLKRRSQFFEILFVTTDLLVVSCAWCLAYWVRFSQDFLPEIFPADKGVPPFSHYLSLTIFIWLIWAFVFKRMGLYRPMRAVRRRKELWLLINANALALIVFIATTYLFREKSVPYSRLVFVYFGIFATFLTIFQRSALRVMLREVRRRGYNLRYMLIVGAGQLAGDVAKRVRRHREIGIQVIGCLAREAVSGRGPQGMAVVGTYSELPDILREREIDQVVVALPLEDNHLIPKIMGLVDDSMVDVKIVPDICQFLSVGNAIEEFEGLPVITIRSSPIEGINLVLKRGVDLVLAITALLFLAPLMLLIALIVKVTSSGPVLYVQERISLDGSRFRIFKFRTMFIDAEVSGPGWTKVGDARITPIGKILRQTSLDELPQLFNVLAGEMSIVGPRPERPVFIDKFREHIPRYMLRHKVPAGMTGWAQIHGWRGDTSIEKRIEHDLYYIENWSISLDFKILALTLFKGFRNRNAY